MLGTIAGNLFAIAVIGFTVGAPVLLLLLFLGEKWLEFVTDGNFRKHSYRYLSVELAEEFNPFSCISLVFCAVTQAVWGFYILVQTMDFGVPLGRATASFYPDLYTLYFTLGKFISPLVLLAIAYAVSLYGARYVYRLHSILHEHVNNKDIHRK